LWADSGQDNADMSAAVGRRSTSRAQAAPRSRSTSLLDRDAYRVLGYRQCGERAVRVDILERLADLIRPATVMARKRRRLRKACRRRFDTGPRYLLVTQADDLAHRLCR